MVPEFSWSRALRGRSYDLGRMTLPDLWRAYITYPTIDLYIVLAVLLSVVAIAAAGSWEAVAVPVLAVIILFPLVWYCIHRFIMHSRWFYRMGWSAAIWKRIHFDHHQDPHLLEVLFGAPEHTLPTIAVVTGPVGYAIGGWSGAAAACAAGLVMACVYEFFHSIQHLNYKPKSRVVLRIKQLHMIHHFHNESVNHGIVSFLPDMLCGTYSRTARECPKSPTVFNLGYDLEEAQHYPRVMELTGTPPRDRPARAFAASNPERAS